MRVLLIIIALVCVLCLSAVAYLLFTGKRGKSSVLLRTDLPDRPKVISSSGKEPLLPMGEGYQWVYRVFCQRAKARRGLKKTNAKIDSFALLGVLQGGKFRKEKDSYYITYRIVKEDKNKVYHFVTFIDGVKEEFGEFAAYYDGQYTWQYHSAPKFAHLLMPAEAASGMAWQTRDVVVTIEAVHAPVEVPGFGLRPCIRAAYTRVKKSGEVAKTQRWYYRGVGLVKVKNGPGISSFHIDENWQLISFMNINKSTSEPLRVKALPKIGKPSSVR